MTPAPAPVPGRSTAALFEPFSIGSLELANRIVMAPMTRAFAPDGVPHQGFADYYRRRAEGGVGLIVTQGTWIPHETASNNPGVPRFYGDDALAGWRRVVEAVHGAGGRIIPQLWHVGLIVRPGEEMPASDGPNGPSGLSGDGRSLARPMAQRDIDDVIEAFAASAVQSQSLGFDGIELHGAHGYLLDQFFWHRTNERVDAYGGDLVARTRLAVEVITEIKRRTGPGFPLCLRFSQWKLQDYEARLAEGPEELERWLEPLVEAGVDVFHCSTRRFWEPAFAGSELNLAGWTKKLTGRPTITVGSIGLDEEFMRRDLPARQVGLEPLLDRLEAGEFDLVALGRPLISDPRWAERVRRGALSEITSYHPEHLTVLA